MEFLILGPIDVRDGSTSVALGGIKPRAVIAVLLLHANEPVSAERLALALWGEDVKSEGTSRVTWEIEKVADSCRLTVTHDQLREGANDQLYGGWPMILSGLKTWIETETVLTTPGSLMYG